MLNPFRHLARTNVLPTPAPHVDIDSMEAATAYYASEGHRQAVALALLVDAKDDEGICEFTNSLTPLELRLLATALAANWLVAVRPTVADDDMPAWLRGHALKMETWHQ